MVKIRIYVEGGGDQASLKTKCRKGFRLFFEKILPDGKMPKIIACGSRRDTYNRFCTALMDDENTFCILLVDSEGPVSENSLKWVYLKTRFEDGWDKPQSAGEENVHLMVQCMESWFLADKNCLQTYYNQGFVSNSLPKNPNIEALSKHDVYDGLKKATRNTRVKGKYGKGSHSFDILSKIDPVKVRNASRHANLLIETITEKVLT